MPSRVDAALERRLDGHPRIAKLLKYMTASAAGVTTNQIVLLTCLVALDFPAMTSNIIAVTAGSIPNYLINRAWTFNKRGSHSFTREMLPFWGMAVLGLILSTLAVGWADQRYGANPVILSAANIGSFGLLWVAKFFVLDRVLFAPLAELVETHEDGEGHLHLHVTSPSTHPQHGEEPDVWPEAIDDTPRP